jgi:hypothetical protein
MFAPCSISVTAPAGVAALVATWLGVARCFHVNVKAAITVSVVQFTRNDQIVAACFPRKRRI